MAYLGVFVLLVLWLLVLILLLASTADIFFVPPMEFLSDKLKLSPDIAGITLLALGNGAPDVMTVRACVVRVRVCVRCSNVYLVYGVTSTVIPAHLVQIN